MRFFFAGVVILARKKKKSNRMDIREKESKEGGFKEFGGYNSR